MFNEIFFISVIVIFALRIIVFYIGAMREKNKPLPEFDRNRLPFISVVVPARNEEDNIAKCINSVAANDYPADRFEIIAVNDRSTDRTEEILNELKERIPNLVILNIKDESQKGNLLGKAGALQAGINIARGEIIHITDADCIVSPKWVEMMARPYIFPEMGFVASFTYVSGKKIFERIQAIEWAYLHTMACAGVGYNQPLGCFGNNTSIRKKDFQELGGYNKIRFSVTEDLAMMLAVYRHGRKLRYLTKPEAVVDTLPCNTFHEYIRQHHRWTTGGVALGWRAVIFVLTSSALWAGIFYSLITGNFFWLAAIILTRLIGDFSLVSLSLSALKKEKMYVWIPVSIFFFTFMELLTPFFLLNKKIIWKGQVFKK